MRINGKTYETTRRPQHSLRKPNIKMGLCFIDCSEARYRGVEIHGGPAYGKYIYFTIVVSDANRGT